MTHRIAQILYDRVHHVFEWEDTDPAWEKTEDAHGNPIPKWPPTEEGPVVLVNVTGMGINEGAGWNPKTNEAIPQPEVAWNEKTYEFDIDIRPEADVTGIKS